MKLRTGGNYLLDADSDSPSYIHHLPSLAASTMFDLSRLHYYRRHRPARIWPIFLIYFFDFRCHPTLPGCPGTSWAVCSLLGLRPPSRTRFVFSFSPSRRSFPAPSTESPLLSRNTGEKPSCRAINPACHVVGSWIPFTLDFGYSPSP